MARPDWLSIEEISRLWGEETGTDPSAIKQDLEAWFSAFIKQSPASQSLITGKSADTTNRLMGMLGARHLERQTFEAYCEERGHPKPRFWFSGHVEEPRREAPRQSAPTAREREPQPPQSGQEPPSGRRTQDPDLESFQTQIASMSERLKPPSFEYRDLGKSAADDETGQASQHPQSEPAPETIQQEPIQQEPIQQGPIQQGPIQQGPIQQGPIQQELIHRADAAAAEARQLEAQLEAAERRIADLSAAAQASRVPSPARPSAPHPESPNAMWSGPAKSPSFEQRDQASYQDPSAASQRLRKGARRKGRSRALLVAGLAVPLAAVAVLLYWDTDTLLQTTDSALSPASTETADRSAGALSSDPTGGKLGLTASPSPADAQDLAAAQEQIARLAAAVEASDSVAARLRAELAIARQTIETARQSRSTQVESEAVKQQRKLAQAAAKEASSLRAALAGAEQKIAALDSQRQAARGATSDARAETRRLEEALQQAKEQTDVDIRDLALAATASSAKVAALQRDLAEARKESVDLGRERSAASASVSGLRASLQKSQEETEGLRDELQQKTTASSAQLATLRKELRAAQRRIAELSDAADAAEDEATELRERLAARHPERPATAPAPIQVLDSEVPAQSPEAPAQSPEAPAQSPEPAEEAVEPGIEVLPTGAANPSDPERGGFAQVAALAPNQAALQTDAIADTVSPDDLLGAPGRHLGQEVVVTGSVVWLLWRYRLQSSSGSDSIVVDVDGLRPAAQQELENALNRVGILGEVQARIRGTVLRKGDESYRLAASELVLVD